MWTVHFHESLFCSSSGGLRWVHQEKKRVFPQRGKGRREWVWAGWDVWGTDRGGGVSHENSWLASSLRFIQPSSIADVPTVERRSLLEVRFSEEHPLTSTQRERSHSAQDTKSKTASFCAIVTFGKFNSPSSQKLSQPTDQSTRIFFFSPRTNSWITCTKVLGSKLKSAKQYVKEARQKTGRGWLEYNSQSHLFRKSDR